MKTIETTAATVDQEQVRRQAVRQCLARAHRAPAQEARREFATVRRWTEGLSYSQALAVCFIIKAQNDPAYESLGRWAMSRCIARVGTPMPVDLPAIEKGVVVVVRRLLRRR